MKPETFEAHGHTWTSHTPGDPMPCDENTPVEVFLRREITCSEYLPSTAPAKLWNWGRIDYEGDEIIGWRYADKPEPSELDKLQEEVESMLEAIREAHIALKLFEHEDGCFCEAAFSMCDGSHPKHSKECKAAQEALAKLQPFITPTK